MWWPVACMAIAGTATPALGATLSLMAQPGQVVGDGTTPVTLTIEVQPAAAASRLADLQVSTSAGVVGDIRDRGEGRFSVDFVPPRVAASHVIELEASAGLAGKKLRANRRLAAVPPPDAAATLTSSGPAKIRATARLVLGRDRGMEIVVTAAVERVARLVVNTGWVTALQAMDGGLVATYTTPAEKYPQVLLIAALDPGGALVDWLAVPLYGQAQITTDTEPRADVRIQVGDTLYGPVRSDAHGRSSLVVAAPPGVKVAATIASDRYGGVEHGKLDLGVPPFGRLLAVCPDTAENLTLIVVDETGRPDLAARLALTTDRGNLGTPIATAGGVYTAPLALPTSVQLGDRVAMRARLTNATTAVSCDASVRGGPPTRLVVRLDPARYVAGSGVPVHVTIELTDAAGRPALAGTIDVAVDLGVTTPALAVAAGRNEATWSLPEHLQGKRKAFATARVAGATLRGEAALELLPGRATALTVASAAPRLVADGESTAPITVTLSDASGNRIPGATMETEARGVLSALAYDETLGSYTTSYTTPRFHTGGEDRITVRHAAADLEASTPIALTAPLLPLALGLRGGYTTNFGAVSTPLVAADITWRAPLWQRRLFVGLEVSYALSDRTRSAAGADEVDTSVSSLPVLARLGIEQPIVGIVSLYAGGTAGAAIVRRSTNSSVGGRSGATTVHGAFGGFGGLHVIAGPGRIVLEAAYRHIALETADLEGNAGGLAVTAGYRFEL